MEKFFKDQKEIEEQLMLLQNIEIVEPFLEIKSSNYPDFSKLFLLSIFIELALALIIAPFGGKS